MQLSDHSLRQPDAAALERLGEDALRVLSLKLLEDLKEARERLNQIIQNSLRPPRSDPPWQKPEERPSKAEDEPEADGADEPKITQPKASEYLYGF